MFKKVFEIGSKLFIIISSLLAISRLLKGKEEKDRRKDERDEKMEHCLKALSIGGLLLGIGALIFKIKEDKREHHLL